MNEYELNMDICPSSLNEEGVPMDMAETGHRWDFTGNTGDRIVTCSECGANRNDEQVVLVDYSSIHEDELIDRKEHAISVLSVGTNGVLDNLIIDLLEVERELTKRES